MSVDIQLAFIPIWVEHKMLPLRVGSRRVVADALQVLLPRNYTGSPLTLYRGTSNHERRRLFGFSWTTDVAIAQKFAKHWAKHQTGLVLRTLAPPTAVLLIRQPEDYYDEGEVVVNPYRLNKVEVSETLHD